MFWWNHQTGDCRQSWTGNPLDESQRWTLYDNRCIRNFIWKFSYFLNEEATPIRAGDSWIGGADKIIGRKERDARGKGRGAEEEEVNFGQRDQRPEACRG